VVRWYGERDSLKSGRGGVPGSLTFFSARCGLSGRKRRRLGDNSPTSTRSEVRSPTSTSTEVRSPTSTATDAFTSGNVTVTGGAGKGDTVVHVHGMPASRPRGKHTGNARRQEVKQALRTRSQERSDDAQTRRFGAKPRATDKPKRRR
jgi:hypothetical protein